MNNLLNYLKKYFNFLLFMVKCNYIVNLGIIKMKNLELNNLLSLGNIVVAQLYEENLKNKLKDLFARIEDNFLSKIKNKKTKIT
ncbi:hypothetical protein B5C39_01710 [Mesomycoplasma hyopneumoniae]|uniref:Uncharacterized protein n=3 Tax=Mesomycoplasma hyopneumoniae TaxID=2099 RepID=Q601P1_MESH2|nr:hypothetical protein mhp160 [Mesomycoplasma hyopneumoniae 232]MCI8283261.1 hypothetical protein [Mesomycoplasma hyopneumoniae]MCI8298193.1 hypothetical protein [Mesomycoplasma hyopneumoniae]OWG15464.1 hypothetical protein B5C39_01710 [Mesomycoplasma hyopneumoniae]